MILENSVTLCLIAGLAVLISPLAFAILVLISGLGIVAVAFARRREEQMK